MIWKFRCNCVNLFTTFKINSRV